MSRVSKDNVEEILPLLPGQGTLFPKIPASGASEDLEQAVWELEGRLDPEIFGRALSHVVARQPILRTVFFRARKQPVQLVLKSLPVSWFLGDLRGIGPQAGHAELRRFLKTDRRRHVEAFQGPLLRFSLLRFGEEETRLILTSHPLVLDDWSRHLLIAELLAVYGALRGSRSLPAAEPSPLKTFLVWLKRQGGEELLDFWASYLEGFEKATPLPVDRYPAPQGERTYRPASWRGSLGAETSRRLEALAEERRADPSVLAQAAWALLLARFSGEDDVVFGLTVSSRQADLNGIGQMIGPIANRVPSRLKLNAGLSLSELLHSVTQQGVNFRHTGHVALADIQSKSRIEPPQKLYESLLTFHDEASTCEPVTELLEARYLRFPSFDGAARLQGGDLSLALDVWPGESWAVELTYDREVFDGPTGEQLGKSFACLLESMAANPGAKLSELEMLTPRERQRLALDLDRKAEAYDLERLVPELFESQVRGRPDAVALICGELSLSYAQLNAQANRLAHYLRSRGLGRDARVGVFGERSLGMMATILGVLKAGAAWVPLDPAHPDERLLKVLAAAGLSAVATEGVMAPRLASLVEPLAVAPTLFCWDAAPADSDLDDAASRAAESAEDPPAACHPQDLAYVFYTSGSTGVPKGAMVEHAGMVNHLWAKAELAELDDESIVVQNASHCFDISVWQLLSALLVGGRVLILKNESALEPSELASAVERHGATVLETVPTLLEILLEWVAENGGTGAPERLSSLNMVISNAETLPVPLARRWLELFPGIPLVNTYGATETSDDTTHQIFRSPPPAASPRVVTGRSIRGTATYILGPDLRLLPPGCPGQIASAGVAVGRGYLGAPAMTARVFVPDAWNGAVGERLYLSGDRGILRHDGVLEILGRIDFQVKVRGHRIELGEVEAALVRHPAVRQVAALAQAHGLTNRLLAYFVADEPLDPAELRNFSEAGLPPFAVPERFIQLVAMPINRNGKIDRAELSRRTLPETPATEDSDHVAPRTEVEARIADIWKEVLDVERVSVTDNFFTLGGHSLAAVQARSRINYQLGLDVSLRTVLEKPQLAELAAEVERLLEQSGARDPVTAKIPTVPDAPHHPLSHAQRQLWFQQRIEPHNISYNIPLIRWIEGELDAPSLQRAFQALVDRHASYRTTFIEVDGEPRQRIAPQGHGVGLKLVDLSHLAEPDQTACLRNLVSQAQKTPFDLERPLLRARLFRLGPERSLLLLVFHHLITDFWSGELMVRDLAAFYDAQMSARPPSLPEMAIRYIDYSAWQNERLASGEMERAERYWLAKLAGELEALELPVDRQPQPGERRYASDAASVALAPALVRRLRAFAKAHDVTLFTLLLATANAFFSRLTGQEDILLGTPSANRDHVDTEEVVGFFVNLLVLRSDLEGDPPFLEILERTRLVVLEAFAHQEYPFDLLVQRLNPKRVHGRAPIVSTIFAVLDAVQENLGGGSKHLRVKPYDDAGEWRTPYDFNLAFIDMGPETLECNVVYSRDFFEPASVQRFLGRYETILESVVVEPQSRLSELPWLTAAEQEELRLQPLLDRDTYPLSFPQQDVWFQCQLHPGTIHYNFCVTVELRGPLSPEVFKAAVRAVCERQTGLRAVFPIVDGYPVQRIQAPSELRWSEVDLTTPARDSRDERLEKWQQELTRTSFDSARGPLLRFGLARLLEQHSQWLLVAHHLIIDGTSLKAFLHQVGEAYAAALSGSNEPLSPLEVEYPDFAAWLEARMRAGALATQRAYWRRQLRGALPGFTLPADRPYPPVQSFSAGKREFQLPPERVEELMLQGFGGSLFCLVTAAVKLLFHRLTGHNDITVATPVSMRPPELAEVVGFFANTLPLRTHVGGDPSFRELVERVDAALGEEVRHGSESLRELLGELKVEREASRPLLPVQITQNPSFQGQFGELSIDSGFPFAPGTLFDLWVVVGQRAGGLTVSFIYCRELYEPATVDRLAESLDVLLGDAVERPEARGSELAILSASARRQILVEFNMADPSFPRQDAAHRVFEQRVAERPTAVAAACEGEELSYGGLNAQANRMANHLRSEGVGREDRVGLFGERGLGMLVTMLAVLKSGAAFVALDPEQPDERLGLILDSAALAMIATQSDLAERSLKLASAASSRPAVCCWDTAPQELGLADPGSFAALSAADLDGDTGVHDLAYVCYTSGSTGVPKGAMVEHGGMINHLAAKIELLELDETSVMVQNAAHVFDISVWQSFAALLVGGRVVIYPRDVAVDPWRILAAVERDGATVMQEVPSFVTAMVDTLERPGSERPGLASLRYLICHAETLSPSLCRRWFTLFPRTRLINAYGITECSDDMTHHVMEQPPADDNERTPVGRTIPGLRHYVLDAGLQPVPVGYAGQITMAGVGVGRGYLEDPARTARVIVPDPFAGEPGGRLYLTGDLGRWRDGGVLEFLGRRDHQVKVRGFRIEIGEIEAALRQHPTVSEVVVLAREMPDGARLAAYVLPRPATQPTASELRDHLHSKLPEYMVPTTFTLMEEWPRTATGKVDRLALPEPDRSESTSDFVPPRNVTEELLAGIWAEVIGLERVGVHDGYFDLGGDSILSIRIVSEAQAAGLEIAVADFFKYQTVAELAAALASRARAATGVENAGEEPAVQGDVPMSPAQQGVFEQESRTPHHWNMARMFEVAERIEPALAARAWRYVVSHHDALRHRFVPDASSWRQVATAAETHDFFHHVDLTALPAPRRPAATEAFAAALQGTLDLLEGPLLRVACFDFGEDTAARLLVIVHHLVMDLYSWPILLGDFRSAYEQIRRDETVELGPRTASFQRWSRQRLERSRSAELERELDYWLDQLSRPVASIPANDRQGTARWGELREVTMTLTTDETDGVLRQLPAVYGTQINDVLLTALVEAVAGWTGERTLRVELALHGRQALAEGLDLSRTVGWFASFFPVTLDLRQARAPEAALRAVQQQLAEVPNRGAGYGLLRYLTDDETIRRRLAALPRAEVLFEYLGQLDRMGSDSGWLRPAGESVGSVVAPQIVLPWRLGVQGGVVDGRLAMQFGYCEKVHRRSEIEDLAEGFRSAVGALLAGEMAYEATS